MAFVFEIWFLNYGTGLKQNSQNFVNWKILAKKPLLTPVNNYNSCADNNKASFYITKIEFNPFLCRVAYLSYKETVAVGEAKKMDL